MMLFIAWKLRRSVMFIVSDQINHLLKLRRSDMYSSKFKRSNQHKIEFFVMKKIITATKERVMPLLRSFDCLVAVL